MNRNAKMDWASGRLMFEEGGPAGNRWRLTCAADWMPRHGHARPMAEEPEKAYGELLSSLRSGDLRLVNVETVLGEVGLPIAKGGPNLQVDERTTNGLKAVPFDVACLANNHTLDYGPEGLAETIRALERAGLRTVGAGMSGEEAAKPLVTEVRGVRVGIVNCAEGEACRSVDGSPGAYGIDLRRVGEQIRGLKAISAVAIVVFHGGREYAPLPPPYVVRELRAIAEMGADAIIGHHPHVPQGIEVHRGVPIAYSLGNFMFWFEDQAFYKHAGYVVHLDFVDRTLTGLEIVPYHIHRDGVSPMGRKMRRRFNSDMERVSDLLETPESIGHVWDAFVDRVGREGLAAWLERGVDTLRGTDSGQAATIANLFFTPAHSELFVNGLKRAAAGTLGQSPEWAKALVEHWLMYPYADALALDETN